MSECDICGKEVSNLDLEQVYGSNGIKNICKNCINDLYARPDAKEVGYEKLKDEYHKLFLRYKSAIDEINELTSELKAAKRKIFGLEQTVRNLKEKESKHYNQMIDSKGSW